MVLWALWVQLGLVGLGWSSPPVEVRVLYGFMPGSFEVKTRELLRQDFEPRLPIALKGARLVTVERAETRDLLEAMHSPQVIGVFWVGHPGLVQDHGKLLNSFLQTSSGAFVPKSIATAAHARFRFFGLVSCHFTDIKSRYFDPAKQAHRFQVLTPDAQAIDQIPSDEDRLLHEVSSLFVAPGTVLERVSAVWPEMVRAYASSPTPKEGAPTTIDIVYRDLLSSKFSYEVMWNGSLIGILDRVLGHQGRSSTQRITIPSTHPIHQKNTLEIRPDDFARARKASDPVHLIDDILIDQVTVQQGETVQPLLNQPIHLGDDSDQWDVDTKSSHKSNEEDFKRNAPALEWNTDVSF